MLGHVNGLDSRVRINDIFFIAGSLMRVSGNAVTIGLLPDIPPEKYEYLGKASLLGSSLCLLSQDYRNRKSLAHRMTYIDLSTFPGYMDHYTAALFLPYTDLYLFSNSLLLSPS